MAVQIGPAPFSGGLVQWGVAQPWRSAGLLPRRLEVRVLPPQWRREMTLTDKSPEDGTFSTEPIHFKSCGCRYREGATTIFCKKHSTPDPFPGWGTLKKEGDVGTVYERHPEGACGIADCLWCGTLKKEPEMSTEDPKNADRVYGHGIAPCDIPNCLWCDDRREREGLPYCPTCGFVGGHGTHHSRSCRAFQKSDLPAGKNPGPDHPLGYSALEIHDEPNRFDPYEALDTINRAIPGTRCGDEVRSTVHALRAYITGMER